MAEKEELEVELSQDIIQRYLGLTTKTFFFLVVGVILMGIYIGIILYGKNSIGVLFKLQAYESFLKDDIKRLKTQNAALQKEYFELKEISGDLDKGKE